MTAIFVCGPDEILLGGCPNCGGWLHVEIRGGVEGPDRIRACSDECIEEMLEFTARVDEQHLAKTGLCAACGFDWSEHQEWCVYTWWDRLHGLGMPRLSLRIIV